MVPQREDGSAVIDDAGQGELEDDGLLQQEDTLIDRGVDDALDEGYSPPGSRWV